MPQRQIPGYVSACAPLCKVDMIMQACQVTRIERVTPAIETRHPSKVSHRFITCRLADDVSYFGHNLFIFCLLYTSDAADE